MSHPHLHDAPASPGPASAVSSSTGDALGTPHRGTPGRSVLEFFKKCLGAIVAMGGFGVGVFGTLGVLVGGHLWLFPNPEEKPSDGLPMILVGLAFIFTGRFLWKLGLSPFRHAQRLEQLLGFLRARVRVRVSEAATHLQVSEKDAQAMLDVLIARHEADFVYFGEEYQYVHREELARGRALGHCPFCERPIGETVLPPQESQAAEPKIG